MEKPGHDPGRKSQIFWPNQVQMALLRASLGQDETVHQAWSNWRSCVTWEEIDAQSARLLPLVYRNLRLFRIDDPLLPRLKGVFLRTLYQQALLFDQVAKVLHQFRKEEIDCVLLKGAPLGLVFYGGIGIRPMDDVDILVRRTEVLRAARVLGEAHWRVGFENLGGLLEATHACPFFNGPTNCLDLHWGVIAPSADLTLDDCFWDDTVEFEFLGTPQRTLNPTDQLLHAVAQGLLGSELPMLRWIPDAVLILRSAEIDWDRFCREARKRFVAAPCSLALAFLEAESLHQVPSSVIRSLEQAPDRWFDRRYLRLCMRDPATDGPFGALERLGLRSLRSTRGRPLATAGNFLKTLRMASSHSGKSLLTWGLLRSIARVTNIPLNRGPRRHRPVRRGCPVSKGENSLES